ncbi:MAG: tRNA 2-thiouridine(34) synthase MnmA [Chloroflexi bacterium]|nr:tRNA 2-thiouridine(34) synthase MnmA [Chloroflexota bacterium]
MIKSLQLARVTRAEVRLQQTVLVGMSGGVDSSVAAALLHEAGYRVVGITFNVWPEGDNQSAFREDACCALGAVEDARRVCDRLGVPHYVVNLRDVFQRRVIDNFVAEYRQGRTPNPCVRCNQFIKFDALLAKAEALNADCVATGHYARTTQLPNGRWALRKAADGRKDQSYVLFVMGQDRLARVRFPLGDLQKGDTRQVARDLGLHVADKPESQEICFVPTRNYRDYLREEAPESFSAGPLVNESGEVVGQHEGIAMYTVGQRKGIGLAAPQPLYVTQIDVKNNTIVVGGQEGLFRTDALVEACNWMAIEGLSEPKRVRAKARSHAEEAPAWIEPEGDRVRVIFDEPQRALTPGQAIVFYEDDLVVGGGILAASSARSSAASSALSIERGS